MTRTKRQLALAITLGALSAGLPGGLFATPGAAAAPSEGSIADVAQGAGALAIEPRISFDHGVLVVTGPEGTVARRQVTPDASFLFVPRDDADRPLADGLYRWELRLATEPAVDLVRAAEEARSRGDHAAWKLIQSEPEPEVARLAGSFELTGGVMTERGPSGTPGPLTVEPQVVGILTATPDSDVELHIVEGLPEIRLESTTGTWDMRVSINDYQIVDTEEFFPVTVLEIEKLGASYTLTFDGDVVSTGVASDGSSRDLKRDLEPVPPSAVLETVNSLPLYRWSYIRDPEGVRHLGPIAEDFHAAFGLGRDDKHISPADSTGVALAAIQALTQRLEEKDREILELRQRLEALERRGSSQN